MRIKKMTAAIVGFDRGLITGEQIAALVQGVVTRPCIYVEQRIFWGRYLISFGQSSDYDMGRNVRVTPAYGLTYFLPGRPYYKVMVTSHWWGGPRLLPDSDDQIIRYLKAFATELKAAYRATLVDGFPSYSRPPIKR